MSADGSQRRGGRGVQSRGEYVACMLGGGMAGTAVDVALYPLDTIKTRLQSEAGFWRSGGFAGVYRGLSSAAAGSAPCGEHQRGGAGVGWMGWTLIRLHV